MPSQKSVWQTSSIVEVPQRRMVLARAFGAIVLFIEAWHGQIMGSPEGRMRAGPRAGQRQWQWHGEGGAQAAAFPAHS